MIINFPLVLLAWASVPSLVTSSNTQSFPLALRSENITAPLIQNATTNKIEQARQVVKDAIAEATKRNKARLDHPARKINKLKPGTQINTKRDDGEKPAPALLEITHEIAAAAALLAELDASTNDTVIMKPRASSFWMENISRKGTHPTSWGGSSGYKIYRNVKDYGAKGDGKTVCCVRPNSVAHMLMKPGRHCRHQ